MDIWKCLLRKWFVPKKNSTWKLLLVLFVAALVLASTGIRISLGSSFAGIPADHSDLPSVVSPEIVTESTALLTTRRVDAMDESLFDGKDLNGDSTTATVMGMATGYSLEVYQRFVGSLRKTGYKGHIIIGVAPDVSSTILNYFREQNVTPKILQWSNCTYRKIESEIKDIFKETQCEVHYPDIKIRWSRFPLQADWLRECESCTGPVLIMDVRDSFFQLDPFGPGSPVVKGLQVFEEDPSQTTDHWLTKWPIKDCKGIEFTKPMLCSGTTVGTRVAMLKYLEIMYEEMKVWINDEKCRFDINGDDQSIHNYLFYTGQLPFATAIPNRSGGIVNTVGKLASDLWNAHLEEHKTDPDAKQRPYKGANDKTWIGIEFGLTDEDGFLVEADRSRSRVIHQYDRFGPSFLKWLHKNILDKRNDSKSDELISRFERSLGDSTIRPNVAQVSRMKTDTGVDVSDPALYESVDLNGDSTTATVMGMATGYALDVYERFVGSLRKSGFKGNIILGVSPVVSRSVLDYFNYRKVSAKIMKWGNCTYRKIESEKKDIFKETQCEVHYPDIKIRWSRFPLQADWLRECESCTGPVLIMDVRDSFFQLDPFGPGSPVVKGLQVFEEDPSQTTDHWLTKWPIKDCKGIEFTKPMLCSGTTVGTRVAMLKYLEIMYEEMKVWINDEKCRFDINGDDQSIHNYLFYTGQLPFATAIPNRSGGIVNTVGKIGSNIVKAHVAGLMKEQKLSKESAERQPFVGANESVWIGVQYNITDGEGFFVEADGSRSRVVHQWDRFGSSLYRWLYQRKDFFRDPMPDNRSIPESSQVPERAVSSSNSGVWKTNSNIHTAESMLLKTETGVDISDPVLYESIDLKGDSSTATVMGMASGYDLNVYEVFVGTLRKTGFKGHIILGVAPDVPKAVLNYFQYRNVTAKILQWSNCTYRKIESEKKDIFKETQCEVHYPDIKIRWSRFPLQADWLRECESCTGPVLIMDVRDSFFQLDPFGPGSPVVKGLQVFEEDPSQTTDHWLTKWPIKGCKGIEFTKPMLCSGTTVGTRVAMLKYLEIMYEEMKVWINDEKCRFDINGDDQSIHNYLFYTGQLPFATAIPNRSGGIVNTVGVHGAMINKQHAASMKEKYNLERGDAMWKPFEGATDKNWIGLNANVTDEDGFFIEADGSRSRVIHQWDRFGRPYVDLWLRKQAYFRDPIP